MRADHSLPTHRNILCSVPGIHDSTLAVYEGWTVPTE